MNPNFIILPVLVLMPVFGAVFLLFLPAEPARRIARWALAASTVALILAGALVPAFLRGGIDDQFRLQFQIPFLPQLGSSIHFGLDGISLPLVLLTNLLCPLALWSSFTAIKHSQRTYYALMLLLQAALTGVFLSMDLLLFYIFFEFTLLPLFLLIGIWGSDQRRPAAFKFFLYTISGGMLILAGIICLVWLHHYQTGILTLDIRALYDSRLDRTMQLWLFAAFFAGFAVKVPLFPFHTWLPLAHTEAPAAGSVLLAAVLLKLGAYGFLRVSLPIFPDASYQFAPFMAVLALIGIIYAALCAWVQTDMKRLVAYSSISHMGFCVLGLFSFNFAGLSGALLYMLSHGLATGALFLLVGMIYERYHTRRFADLGGLARPMPALAFFLIFFSLSSIGLPGLVGFISEFTVLYAVFTSAQPIQTLAGPLGPAYAIIAAFGIILSALYMLWMCQRVLFGPLREPALPHAAPSPMSPDLSCREKLLLVPLAVVILALGVYPRLFFAVTDPALDTLNRHLHSSIVGPDSFLTQTAPPAELSTLPVKGARP